MEYLGISVIFFHSEGCFCFNVIPFVYVLLLFFLGNKIAVDTSVTYVMDCFVNVFYSFYEFDLLSQLIHFIFCTWANLMPFPCG